MNSSVISSSYRTLLAWVRKTLLEGQERIERERVKTYWETGRLIFKFLGITMGDFMIAGGAILFCIAILDIVNPAKQKPLPVNELGAVPLGTPLIVGPGVLTTCLMMVDQHGLSATILAVLMNILIAGMVFYFADHMIRIFGQSGSRALSKVMALLLAAIAIMMIRKGIVQALIG